MPKIVSLKFFAVLLLSLSFTACKDTKTLQENQQLKSQVAQLQKENGQLGNDIETVTAARDELTKENSALQSELSQRKAKRAPAKTASHKRRRGRKSQQG
jgi:peptidoglycan hydrolase CwlO-like protein